PAPPVFATLGTYTTDAFHGVTPRFFDPRSSSCPRSGPPPEPTAHDTVAALSPPSPQRAPSRSSRPVVPAPTGRAPHHRRASPTRKPPTLPLLNRTSTPGSTGSCPPTWIRPRSPARPSAWSPTASYSPRAGTATP